MQRFVGFAALVALLSAVPAAAEEEIVHQATWRSVDLEQPLPDDLAHPQGKTRWELGAVVSTDRWTRTVSELNGGMLAVRDTRDPQAGAVRYSAAARAWWMPHLSTAALDRPLQFSEIGDRGGSEVRVRTDALGSGWVFLPSGPREAQLQRSFVMRSDQDPDRFRPDRVVYRWIDPRAGAVAQIWGRPGPDGRSILEFEGAATIESVLQGGVPLKIFRDEIEVTPYQRLTLGFDRMGTCTVGTNSCVSNDDCTGGSGDECTIPISDLTPIPYATMGDLITGVWDFTPTQLADSRYEIGSTTAPINASGTCSHAQCGFGDPGTTQMGREDKNFNNFTEPDRQDLFMTLSATEGEQRAGDYTIWLRAGIRHEGISTGSLGENESRFCYSGGGRPEVPLWRFGTQDTGGEWYMQNGDSWSHTPFNCEQSLFNHVCPNSCGPLVCELFIKGCSTTATNPGTQSSEVIAEGPVTLPSGHVMNALLVRQVVDFCVYFGSGCGSFTKTEEVEQAIYLWVVPNIGTVARLMSRQDESSETAFTDLQETDLKYGLFPPRSISVTGQTDTTIDLSWDPGTITHHIDEYKIYWDTDSGATTPYAFDSVTNSAQVNRVGTTATISGLTKGTDYFITVTALTNYTDVATGVTTTYESLLFPTSASGASGPLPPELGATTTCTPTEEVTGVRVNETGSGSEMCWTTPADSCVDTYTVLGALSPESETNFTTVISDTGGLTCALVDLPEKYFLVIGKGTGGTGPWGHFGM